MNNRENKVLESNNKNGQIKCPHCGATDIFFNEKTGALKCNYCRNEFAGKKVSQSNDIDKLEGQVISEGAQNIIADTNDVVTFKCQGCGAEVVIDTAETTQARCHWCRSFLSINEKIPNGSVPDAVLPFLVKKEDAESTIKEFVNSRKFFAHPKFKQEFTSSNIMGVYFPYMLVDINAHANFSGEGEHLIRRYTVGSGDNKKTYYDADLYRVERDFDITIDDLSVESSSDKLDFSSENKTNNIINSIMPFDTENCVAWNANYLRGFSSEKRDTNIEELKNIVNIQSRDISRIAINDTLKFYDRGVEWTNQQLNIKGERWQAAYLPVWLYSYQEVKKEKKLLHYVAVNARTKEVMGSIPINIPKLLFVSFLVEILSGLSLFVIDFENDWIVLSAGIIFYFIMYARYRNSNKRHMHEKETRRTVSNVKSVDRLIERRTRLRNFRMNGANNTKVYGDKTKNKFIK